MRVELSKDAMELAKRNVDRSSLERCVRVLGGDLFAPVKGKRYDLIIANPPYVHAAGMTPCCPNAGMSRRLAFDGGADGLAVVRRILIAPGGT